MQPRVLPPPGPGQRTGDYNVGRHLHSMASRNSEHRKASPKPGPRVSVRQEDIQGHTEKTEAACLERPASCLDFRTDSQAGPWGVRAFFFAPGAPGSNCDFSNRGSVAATRA